MPKIIIHDSIHPVALDNLTNEKDYRAVEIRPSESDKLKHELIDADGIILRYLPLNKEALKLSKQLKVIARHGVGYDNIDMEAATRLGIPVATIGDANSVTVAELTLYLILVTAKKGLFYDRAVRKGEWFNSRESLSAIELFKKNVLIVGFGRIGKLVAARCKAFEMNVLVYDPYIDEERIVMSGYRPVTSMIDGISVADIITLHVPLTKETFQLVDDKALKQFKKNALLINTSRGSVIDEEALHNILKIGHNILSVGLDVFENEPVLITNPILQLENITLTPHIGGLTEECYYRSSIRCVKNIIDGINGNLDSGLVINSEVLAKE